MIRFLFILPAFLLSAIAQGQILPTLGGQRVGISTLTFLKSDVSPRSMALSGANLTLSADGMSAFHNTALMAQNERIHVALTNLSIGAGAQQSWISTIVPLKNSYSAVALNINYFSTGAMEVRTEFQPQGTGEIFYANQMAIGLAYA